MGLLRNAPYWSKVLNEMTELKPSLGQKMSPELAARIQKIACAALSALTRDKELSEDLEQARELTGDVRYHPNVRGFEEFLQMFMLLESKILSDAGVNPVAANDLLLEVQMSARQKLDEKERFNRLDEKIGYCAKLACGGVETEASDDPRKSVWARVWRATAGVAQISADMGFSIGALVFLSPIGAVAASSIIGISTGYGADLVSDAIRDKW